MDGSSDATDAMADAVTDRSADGPRADACSSSCCDSAIQCATVDQQQLQLGTVPNAVGSSSEQKLAQVVTAGRSGSLVGVRLPVTCVDGFTVTIQILGVTAAGAPSASVLSSTIVDPIDDFYGETMQEFSLAQAVPLTAGGRFAIALSGPPTVACGMRLGIQGDTYSGGKAFYDSRPDPPAWNEMSRDLVFQTLMAP